MIRKASFQFVEVSSKIEKSSFSVATLLIELKNWIFSSPYFLKTLIPAGTHISIALAGLLFASALFCLKMELAV